MAAAETHFSGGREREKWKPPEHQGGQRRCRSDGNGYNFNRTKGDGNYISYYFSNFDEEWNVSRLWKVFKEKGAVTDIYVARKKNRDGACFGFVRFKKQAGESDYNRLKSLNEVYLGKKKIYAHWATERKNLHGVVSSKGGKTMGNRIRETAGNVRGKTQPALIFNSKAEEKSWLEKALVGEVVYPENLNILAEKEFDGRHYGCIMRCLGGSKVLLTFEKEKGREEFIKAFNEQNDEALEIFGSIKPWESKDVDARVFKWLRLEGIPVHAFNERLFSSIGNLWGTFVMTDKCTALRRRFDIARILVYTYRMDFPAFMDVEIDEEIWRITIAEESVCSMLPIPYDYNIPEEMDSMDDAEAARSTDVSPVVEKTLSPEKPNPPVSHMPGNEESPEAESSRKFDDVEKERDRSADRGSRTGPDETSKEDIARFNNLSAGISYIEPMNIHVFNEGNIAESRVEPTIIEVGNNGGDNVEKHGENGKCIGPEGPLFSDGLISVEVLDDQMGSSDNRPVGDFCEPITVEKLTDDQTKNKDGDVNIPKKVNQNSGRTGYKRKKRSRKKLNNMNIIQEETDFWKGFDEYDESASETNTSKAEAEEVVKVAKALGLSVTGTWEDVLERATQLEEADAGAFV